MSDALRDALVEAATKAFMRFAGRDPDAEIAVYDCDVPTRLPAWELQVKAMEAALDAAEALSSANSREWPPRITKAPDVTVSRVLLGRWKDAIAAYFKDKPAPMDVEIAVGQMSNYHASP